METKEKVCPRCHKKYKEYPALSRRDNKTHICPDCGTAEAFEDYFGIEYRGENTGKNRGQKYGLFFMLSFC